jgi:hypothetical protein
LATTKGGKKKKQEKSNGTKTLTIKNNQLRSP